MKTVDINIDSVLTQAEVKSKKSKSDVVEFSEKMEVVDKITTLTRKMEELETEIKLLEDEVYKSIRQFYIDNCKKHFFKSLRIYGLTGAKLLVSWKHKYNKIPLDWANPIKDIVKDLYNTLFKVKTTITVKDTDNEELLKELINKIGPQEFSKYFEVYREIVPTEKFTTDRYNLLSDEQNNKLDELIQQTHSFKVE